VNVSLALVEEGVSLVDAMAERGLVLRLLGGAAVFLHCPGALAGGPYRELGDLDAMTRRADAPALSRALPERGYQPEARFNALHGDRRLIFNGPCGRLDVFVDSFEMCHRIPLADRLEIEARTLTASDLLLTKLQIVEVNAKDAQDAVALLAEHELAAGPGDHIDVEYLSGVLGADWGLWRTVTGTLARLAEREPSVAEPARQLIDAFERAPKTRAFRLRARVGERVRWYELPDEVG
jgi:hypothetical protein